MELKVTALRSPRRLEVIARSKFGLGTPRSEQIIHFGERQCELTHQPLLKRMSLNGELLRSCFFVLCSPWLLFLVLLLFKFFVTSGWSNMARKQFQSKVLIRPRRGAIVDRNGEPLAINIETSSLAANPSKVDNPKALAKLLHKATEVPYKKIVQRLSGNNEFVWIKRHLTENELHRLKKWRLIGADGDLIPGLMQVKESKRVYPHGELAAHVLGSSNIDSEGVEGIELWQDEKMRGKVLSVSAIKDAMGRPTFIDSVSAKSVQDHRDGQPVTLTIDASLQYAVEQELKNTVTKHSARGGSVIVMNAVNGEILAMANQPAFNPNDKNVAPDRRRNRALTDGYEPGSTLKAVLMASALSNNWKPSDQVWGEMGQGLKIQGRKISEAEAHEKYGWLTRSEAHSSFEQCWCRQSGSQAGYGSVF